MTEPCGIDFTSYIELRNAIDCMERAQKHLDAVVDKYSIDGNPVPFRLQSAEEKRAMSDVKDMHAIITALVTVLSAQTSGIF